VPPIIRLATGVAGGNCVLGNLSDCGVSYLPAGKRAEEAVAANPEKSDGLIAEEIGVGKETVRRARKSTASTLGS
jgi:hypothetical protein